MNDHPRRLVEDEEVAVLVDDRERQRFGDVGAALGGRLQANRDALTGTNALRRARRRRAVDDDVAAADQMLQVVARELVDERDDRLVEPLAVLRGGDRRDALLDDGVVDVVAIGLAGDDRTGSGKGCVGHIRLAG